MTLDAQKLEQEILQQINANPGRDHEALEYVVVKNTSNGPMVVVPLPVALGALESLVGKGALARRSWDGRDVYGLPEMQAA